LGFPTSLKEKVGKKLLLKSVFVVGVWGKEGMGKKNGFFFGGGGGTLQVCKTTSPPFPSTIFPTDYSHINPPTISATDVLT